MQSPCIAVGPVRQGEGGANAELRKMGHDFGEVDVDMPDLGSTDGDWEYIGDLLETIEPDSADLVITRLLPPDRQIHTIEEAEEDSEL